MKSARRVVGVFAVVALISIVSVTGCNSPVSVAPAEQITPAYGVTIDCPTIEQICQMIVQELDVQCPRTKAYRTWGELNSCEKSTIGKALEPYNDCYTDEELKDIRDRVFEMRHSSTSGATDEQPRPYQL
jgi:hypothetical protein